MFPFKPPKNIRKPKMNIGVVKVSILLTRSAEAHSEPSQTSKMELFAKKATSQKFDCVLNTPLFSILKVTSATKLFFAIN